MDVICTTLDLRSKVLEARTTVPPEGWRSWVDIHLVGKQFIHPQLGVMALRRTTLKTIMHQHLGLFVYSDLLEERKYFVVGSADMVPHPECSICNHGISTLCNTAKGKRYNFCPFCGPEEHCIDNFFYFCNGQTQRRATMCFGSGRQGVFPLKVLRHNLRGNKELFLNYRTTASALDSETTTSDRWCCVHRPCPTTFPKRVLYLHMCKACYNRLCRKKKKVGNLCTYCERNPREDILVCQPCRRRFQSIAK
jgi:hypothetical protein